MAQVQKQAKDFLVGAAIGGLLGTAAALLVAPKSGKKMREDLNEICNLYCDKSVDWSEKAKNTFNGFKHWFQPEEESDNTVRDLLVGGVTGGILGAITGLLLAPKAGSKIRQDLSDRYQEFVERSGEIANELGKRGGEAKNKVNEIMEWAALGLRLWEGVKKGRR